MRIPNPVLAFLAVFASACATEGGVGPDAGPDAGPAGFDDREVVEGFVDGVVVPTYSLLASRLQHLVTAVEALSAEPTAANLDAAQEAWVAAREPWEQSEGFLFGPVDTFGYDPALDSWPVNRTDLDAVLASGDTFTPEYVSRLQDTQKGFHTVEYLLFGEGMSRMAGDLGARELAYLEAVTAEMAQVSQALVSSWTDSTAGRPSYRDVFATAGQPGNMAYPSQTAAVQEILGGIIGICDEVANGKIADPYDAQDTSLVESQFAHNSILDFQNNMRSVENVYLGGAPAAGTSGRGLSSYIGDLDPSLDARLRTEIQSAITSIGAIPEPFQVAITTPSSYSAIEDAQEAVRTVQLTLERDVQPLVVR